MTERILETLRNAGFRITRVREAILEILSKGNPVSVEEIRILLKSKKLFPNKTTIYRELEFLQKENFIRSLSLSTEKRMYEITSTGHHHHLVCLKCERVEDIPMENELHKYEKKIARNTSFKIMNHSLEFFGFCYRCQ